MASKMTKNANFADREKFQVAPGPYKGKNFHSQIGPLKSNVHQKQRILALLPHHANVAEITGSIVLCQDGSAI